ncbi:hypothetical protein F2Q70_00008863 [Brassica cretica]|uniref:Uncharacterized protein n=1 Tax=Brassica cretica TaxID=69181 RepID=A0A8S9M7S3_BRACR|nr:hypothetical protein F2Q68_00001895 [Brassica cretica]KAF2615052.1 hypothetical protein F2Q70_00008863 [Brassica cretica]
MSSSDPMVAQSAFHCCASAPFLGLQKQQKAWGFEEDSNRIQINTDLRGRKIQELKLCLDYITLIPL